MASRARWLLPVTLSAALLAVPPIAMSQATSPVIQLLLSAHDVRTRVQAATTLSRLRPPGARQALEQALSDPNAAVRIAAAQSLMSMGEPAALPALRSRSNDPDPGVRATVQQALAAIQQRIGGGSFTTIVSNPMPSLSGPSNSGSNDWERARYVLRVGSLANRAGGRPEVVDILRNAIVEEARRNPEFSVVTGSLPPEAEQRVRAGRLRPYALEGGVNALRRWTIANTLSVRAEVSLVLLSEPGRAIVGSLSGAATAQDSSQGDTTVLGPRLEDRALAAAVRGAMNSLQQSLQTARR